MTKTSPNIGGVLKDPTLLVLHYTAGGSFESSVSWLCSKAAKASAHLVIGRDGEVAQIVPFDRVCWHAGQSEWKGRTGVNSFSIGVELCNAGALIKGADGSFKNPAGVPVAKEHVYHGRHKHPTCAFKYWEEYPVAQLLALDQEVKKILDRYPSVVEICAHEDVSPGRKIDVGAAWDWPAFYSRLGLGDVGALKVR